MREMNKQRGRGDTEMSLSHGWVAGSVASLPGESQRACRLCSLCNYRMRAWSPAVKDTSF